MSMNLQLQEPSRPLPALLSKDEQFETIVRRYWNMVFALAYRKLGNRADAEDQTQEVFIKIYYHLESLHDSARIVAWIRRITITTCASALQQRRRQPMSIDLAGPHGTSEEPECADARQLSPEAIVLRLEEQALLIDALARLDHNARQVLVLRDVKGQTYAEIGALLSLGSSAVKMRIRRARLAMRDILSQTEFGIVPKR